LVLSKEFSLDAEEFSALEFSPEFALPLSLTFAEGSSQAAKTENINTAQSNRAIVRVNVFIIETSLLN
jgi:hypothetical protein